MLVRKQITAEHQVIRVSDGKYIPSTAPMAATIPNGNRVGAIVISDGRKEAFLPTSQL